MNHLMISMALSGCKKSSLNDLSNCGTFVIKSVTIECSGSGLSDTGDEFLIGASRVDGTYSFDGEISQVLMVLC